jgi:hypothetical protein
VERGVVQIDGVAITDNSPAAMLPRRAAPLYLLCLTDVVGHLDLTGDGVAETTAYDTVGDGVADALDTTGDGRIDTKLRPAASSGQKANR